MRPEDAESGSPPGGAGESRSFEEALSRLEQILSRLEDSEVPLEEAIALVQEGDLLSQHCERQLQEAEGKILQLVERMGETALVEKSRVEGGE